ncbi:sulfotransferase [Prochlorococcus sp. AH-716-E17]|nr:sulfotransferase [Prochlorococcus sp. AH-716-E17]
MKGFGEDHQSKNKKEINNSKISVNNQLLKKALALQGKGQIFDASRCYKYLIDLGSKDAQIFSNYGTCLKEIGKFLEAKRYYQKAIELNPKYAMAYSNLGSVLSELGKLEEAEILTRKAIELNPRYATFHFNLGCLSLNLGKLKQAELSFSRTIELKPDYVYPYYSLSLLKLSAKNNNWRKKLFSKNFLEKKTTKEKIEIYFARANILHKEKNYTLSAKNLQLANNLKLENNPSNLDFTIRKSRLLLAETDKKEKATIKDIEKYPENIFIVGMPRSGSTLVESIISINSKVNDLGETNILEEAFLESKRINQKLNLMDLYSKKIISNNKGASISTNKLLYNFQYAGIISKQIPNAKIIHCFRNPLDNILSIYRAHFTKGNYYSSSLIDCAKVYLNQKEIMDIYKKRFPSNIYNLDYDLLVKNPNKMIRLLIKWLGWEWNDSYLSPHLNTRPVFTRSSVQVRSPINSNSIGNWRNYKKMLNTAIEVLLKNKKYQN